MNPKATSGYDCVKKGLGLVGCWSTEGKCPECNEQVIYVFLRIGLSLF